MKWSIPLLILLLVCYAQDVIRLEHPVYIEYSTDDKFQYDDGSSHWLSWDGLYRGVWFDTQDFIPGSPGCMLSNSEFWFYHHADRPWDTSEFYAELWNGSPSGFINQMDLTQLTAVHNSGVYAEYYPDIGMSRNFWCIVNTELSDGGWPSLLGDNTPNTVDHSFYSDDFTIWEPWIMTGTVASDYFIMASGVPLSGLQSATWGTIKTLYR